MSVALALAIGLLVGAGVALGARKLRDRRPRRATQAVPGAGRVMLPFGADGITEAALHAALRLARSESGVLVATALVVVPRRLPPDAALPRQSEHAIATLEAVELEGARAGVAVDGRIERGRTLRHALAEALAHEPAERVVVSARDQVSAAGHPGFGPDDVAWLLGRVAPEVVVLRPALPREDGPA